MSYLNASQWSELPQAAPGVFRAYVVAIDGEPALTSLETAATHTLIEVEGEPVAIAGTGADYTIAGDESGLLYQYVTIDAEGYGTPATEETPGAMRMLDFLGYGLAVNMTLTARRVGKSGVAYRRRSE